MEIKDAKDVDTGLIWQIFSEVGEVPIELLSPDQHSTPGYEIRLAIPSHGGESSYLYHYFPTLVQFPLPLTAHATLENSM